LTRSIAHRGDWTNHPENTLPAFQDAVTIGADMLELDVKVTLDGRAVLLHDDTLNRIWSVARAVRDMTWQEIREACLGPYQIPLFEDIVSELDIPMMVDFTDDEAVDSIVEVLRKQPDLDRFLVVTGRVSAIRRVKQLLPIVTTGLTWDKLSVPEDDLLKELGVSYFNPYWQLVNPVVVQHMRDRNLLISCWTVDQEQHMKSLIELGVDAIVTNQLQPLVTLLQP